MKKRSVIIIFCLALLVSMSSVVIAEEVVGELAKNVVAEYNTSAVLVNGEEVAFEAYTINGNNYFKLRDIAMAINGSEKNFEVKWDQNKFAINLVSNTNYTSDGSELLIPEDKTNKEGVLSTSKIYLDDEEIKLTAYTISQNNYIKLRDFGQVFDFLVDWMDGTIVIDTSLGYMIEELKEVEETINLPEIYETGEAIIVKVPAMPEKGFKWPYMLKVPTNTYKNENADATKRYLMFEMANTQLERPEEMEITVKERLENLWASTIWLAEKTWSPVMMPLIPRTHVSYFAEENYEDQNFLMEHDLDRDIVMLKELMKDDRIKSELEKSYERDN